MKSSMTKVKMENSKIRQIRDFNEIFTCDLCDGYMIEPTTVDNCGHAFCRSCILKHLLKSDFCPSCGHNSDSINTENLGSDTILRSLIYKMAPNLYQMEKDRQAKFYSHKKRNLDTKTFEKEALKQEPDDDFFMPTEPISLSLEYHPELLEDCQDGEIPPIRYLQCPAIVQIQHLKRFLYSKFALDPLNERVALEIIYEDEILPDHFMLMDVGYCYKWRREAPMRFMYRVMVYSQPPPVKVEAKILKPDEETKSKPCKTKTKSKKAPKTVKFARETTTFDAETVAAEIPKSHKTLETKEKEPKITPVKVVIARKSASKRSHSHSHVQSHNHKNDSQAPADTEPEPVAPTNDFKSLRSNDIRFSDYTVTTIPATTKTKTNSKTTTAKTSLASSTSKAQNLTRQTLKSSSSSAASSSLTNLPQASVVPIVVSIPQSQVKSPYVFDDQIDNLSLAQLKSACKKSPNVTATATSKPQTEVKNVPKLKIELSSLKTKLSISKPKSADAIYEFSDNPPVSKKSKHRKHSLDESGPINDRVDLETYAKNIGLKPIEVVTPAVDESEKFLKYSPNASPMSSCSSSTTCSSNGNLSVYAEFGCGSSSSHKKHKKKHSKEPREPKEGKRRKLHAEISSQPADESLKMKVKITSTGTTHSHKSHKTKSTPTTPTIVATISTEPKILITPPKSPPKLEVVVVNNHSNSNSTDTNTNNSNINNNINNNKKIEAKPVASVNSPKTSSKPDAIVNMVALNKALGEEAQSIKKLMRCEKNQVVAQPVKTHRPPPLLPKPVISVKEPQKLPTSPPLPPSLFKTTSLTFPTHVSNNTAVKPSSSTVKPQELPKLPAPKAQPFAVPSPPRGKLFATPSSIASSVNKAASMMHLKRSASLDDPHALLSKQQRLEQDRLLRKSAYGPALGANMATNAAKLMQQQFQTKEELTAQFYAPLISPFVLPQQRPLNAAGMTSPPLNITKFNDAILKSVGMLQPGSSNPVVSLNRTPTLPTLTQAQLNLLAASSAYQQLPGLVKSPLEIVRLPPAPIPVESLQPNLPPPLNIPKNNRLMGPPASIANKVKKPAPLSPSTIAAVKMANLATSTSVASSAVSAANAFSGLTATTSQKVATNTNTTAAKKSVSFRSSPPALINFRSSLPVKPAPVRPTIPPPILETLSMKVSPKATETKQSNGAVDATSIKPATKSLREFRPVSKDNSVDILDLSGGKLHNEATNLTATNNAGNSLEAALNKMKQSITTCTVTSANKSASIASASVKSIANNNINNNNNSSGNKNSNNNNNKSPTRNDDLLNLQLLSESATAREKIAIKSQANLGNTSNSFFEKTKQPSATLVRQQNASVRNIPNPSALAFRNQQPTTVETTSTTSLPTNSNNNNNSSLKSTTSAANNEIEISMKSPTKIATNSSSTESLMTSPTTSVTATTATVSPTTATTTTVAQQHRPTKKLTTIDQVAASLNMRAVAAATAAAATTSHTEDVATTTGNTTVSASNEKPTTSTAVATVDAKTGAANVNTSVANISAMPTAAHAQSSPNSITEPKATITTTNVNCETTKSQPVVKNSVAPSTAVAAAATTTLAAVVVAAVNKTTDTPSITKTVTFKRPTSPLSKLNNNNNNNNSNKKNNNGNNNNNNNDNNNLDKGANKNNNNNNNNNSSSSNNNNKNNSTPASTSISTSTSKTTATATTTTPSESMSTTTLKSAPLSPPTSTASSSSSSLPSSLPAPSSSSSSSTLSSVSESNQTGLVAQGSV